MCPNCGSPNPKFGENFATCPDCGYTWELVDPAEIVSKYSCPRCGEEHRIYYGDRYAGCFKCDFGWEINPPEKHAKHKKHHRAA